MAEEEADHIQVQSDLGILGLVTGGTELEAVGDIHPEEGIQVEDAEDNQFEDAEDIEQAEEDIQVDDGLLLVV